MLLRSIRLALILFAIVPVTAARAASIWTPLSSGTTEQITAIATPKTAELVYATAGGHIMYLTGGGTFALAGLSATAPFGFTDIAMSPDGKYGVAVGAHGFIYFSNDNGMTWTKKTANEPTSGSCFSGWTVSAVTADQLISVHFAPSAAAPYTAYITGVNNDVLKSVDNGQTWTEANKKPSGCVADSGQEFGDSAWLDPNDGFLLSDSFGGYFLTTDGLAGGAGGTSKSSTGGPNGFTYFDRLAVDLGSPNNAWAIAGGGGGSYFAYTTNGGSSWDTPNYDRNQQGFQDIANVGRNVVVAGLGGDIYTSPDGLNFTRQIAADPNTATNWYAVAMIPGTNTAFVGGANGRLVSTTQANTLPDTAPPTGTIAGPTKLATGQFGSYTVNATDNPGGSGIDPNSFSWSIPGQAAQAGTHATFGFSNAGTYNVTVSFKDLAGNTGTASITIKVSSTSTGSQPVTKGSGGSTVTIFKKVTAGQGKGRFIPVKLSTKKPRRFIVTLLTKNGKHQLATLTTTLKKGHKTVHLRISSKIKSGSYKLVVIVFTTGKHSHPVGGRIKQVFVLR